MLVAITHAVSPNLNQCELSHIPRQEISFEQARAQHAQYEQVLAELGCQVIRLTGAIDMPDSVFVEDIALVLDELAIITRPGAETRRAETSVIAEGVSGFRDLSRIDSPGTIDGGDVLRIEKTLYVGNSERTNESGIFQLAGLVEPYGYEVVPVPVDGCLHLKSAVTQLGENTLLINQSWVEASVFVGRHLIEVDPEETHAANALLVGSEIIYPTSFPKTLARIEEEGFSVHTVDMSELQKAEGAVTCCSLIFRR